MLGAGVAAVSGVGAPAWEWGDLCRVSSCLSFPRSSGIAVGHGETCALGRRDLAQLLHMWPVHGIFHCFFSLFCSKQQGATGAEPLSDSGPLRATQSFSHQHSPPGAVGWDDLRAEPLVELPLVLGVKAECPVALARFRDTFGCQALLLPRVQGGRHRDSQRGVLMGMHVSLPALCCPQSSGSLCLLQCLSMTAACCSRESHHAVCLVASPQG